MLQEGNEPKVNEPLVHESEIQESKIQESKIQESKIHESRIHSAPLDEAGSVENGKSLIVIAVCSVLCMFFLRIGLFSLFYLAPLGYAVLVTDRLRLTFITSALTTIVFLFFTSIIQGAYSANLWMEIFYFTLLFFMFLWVTGGKKLRTAYRFLIAAIVCSIAFLIYLFMPGSILYNVFDIFAEEFFPIFYAEDAAGTAVQQLMSPEFVVETTKNILLRGGSIISLLMMFYINRQIAVTAVWIIKKQRKDRGLSVFFAPANTIWFLTGSLATIIISNIFNFRIPEIIAWNIFTICCIIFLVQGIGIARDFLAKRTQRFRIITNVLVILAIFSPLGVIVILALLILGIVEIWLPVRLGGLNGRASTPEQ